MSTDKPFTVHWRCWGCGDTGTANETKTGEGGPHMKHMRECGGVLETNLWGWAA